MNLFICTISFRHQLISIDQLVKWAKSNHFQGIELWGIHAKNLTDQPQYNQQWLAEHGLRTTMISDYLPLSAGESALYQNVHQLCRLAKHWGARKIRTFANDKGSASTTPEEFKHLVNQLARICDWLAAFNLNLVIETHPNTYADNTVATRRLIEAVGRDNLKINFDVLHVWESKDHVITALDALRPHINHFHLKNIASEKNLSVFSPPNVYSPAGSRQGIVTLFEGAVNYTEFFQYLGREAELNQNDASLEWFGYKPKQALSEDRYLIQQMQQSHALLIDQVG